MAHLLPTLAQSQRRLRAGGVRVLSVSAPLYGHLLRQGERGGDGQWSEWLQQPSEEWDDTVAVALTANR